MSSTDGAPATSGESAAGERPIRALIVGESAYRIHVHFKGFASYETAYLGDNLDAFIETLAREGVALTFMRNHDVSVHFPTSAEELDAYDVVIISDAPADSFLLHPQTLAGERKPNRFRLINDYVRAGKGFLMVGGWMAFGGFHGKAMYHATPLTEILPVGVQAHDDRMEIPEGVHPVVVQPDHAILAGIPDAWPWLLGYNRVLPGRGQTLMTINGDPLLVVDEAGRGRVAIYASDVLPHWAPKEFIAWPYYGRFWGQLIKWLARAC
jgi:uncharacterized membrane protein